MHFFFYHLQYIYYVFCFVKNLWLTNRKESWLSECLDRTDSSAGKEQQAHLEEVSGKQRIEKEEEREKEELQQKSRVGIKSRDKARTMRMTDVEDLAFKNPPESKYFKVYF